MTTAEFAKYLACDCAGGVPFPIEYRHRHPRLRTVHGRKICRGCGGPIGKGRTTWCCHACYVRFDPGMVKAAVKKRDKGKCQLCPRDMKAERRGWAKHYRSIDPNEAWQWKREHPQPGKPEYDHIIPFAKGGLTVVENMRELCRTCHLQVTKDFAAQRARERISLQDATDPLPLDQ